MSQQIDAIYDQRVFKPLIPPKLPDQARVRLTVDAQPNATNSAPQNTDFEAELEPLLFDSPSLTNDISRADIYAESRLMQYLVDTGVWLRLFDRTAAVSLRIRRQHAVAFHVLYCS